MTRLALSDLRAANMARIPEFKNKHGQPAHSRADGSDWNPAQWLQATMGEIGEFAEVRLAFETGAIDADTYHGLATKELADVQTYLSITAARALDRVPVLESPDQACAAQRFMVVLSQLGNYANLRKKLDRGDVDLEAFQEHAVVMLNTAIQAIQQLMVNGPAAEVVVAHHEGVDLERATADKFNEVSKRVSSQIRLVPTRSQVEYMPVRLFRVGDLVRVGGGDTALMEVSRVEENGNHMRPRYNGTLCLGGFHSAVDEDCHVPRPGDQEIWDRHANLRERAA